MWPFHHESKRVIIFKTIGVCCAIVIVAWGLNYFLRRSNTNITSQEKISDNTVSIIAETPAELKTRYIKTLTDLKQTIENNSLSDVEARDKTEQVLFAVRVPKEMLDKHLETVLAVRRLKDKPKRSDVNALIDYLIKQVSV